MNTYHVLSFSGVKTVQHYYLKLFKIISANMPLDEIVYCNTGLDFPEMDEHIKLVKSKIPSSIKFTTLNPPYSFEYFLLHKPVKNTINKNEEGWNGYGWPGPRRRWCTSRLKTDLLDRYYKSKKSLVHVYIGIASDELNRISTPSISSISSNHIIKEYPLINTFNMSEEDCLNYCYSLGFNWGGLYKKHRRLSCWCCPLQNIHSLRTLYNDHPELWNKLKEWDKEIIKRPPHAPLQNFYSKFRTVEDMEKRFKLENSFLQQGKSITKKNFFNEWKKLIDTN